MSTEPFDDVVSAALDGERVDVAALRRALAEDDGRRLLASFVLLRASVTADDIWPARRPVGDEIGLPAIERQSGDGEPRRRVTPRAWWAAGPRIPATLAASLAIVAVASGLWMGTTWQAHRATPVGPNLQAGAEVPATPMPSAMQPAPAPAPSAAVITPPASTQSALPPCAQTAVTGREKPSTRHGMGMRPATGPPTPTRFLRFVDGVDWLPANVAASGH